MFRKVSTLLVLSTFLAIGGCDDEILTDAIPVSDAASASEAAKESGGSASDAATAEAATEEGGATQDAPTTHPESAAPDGPKPDVGAAGDAGTEAAPAASDAADAATDASPG